MQKATFGTRAMAWFGDLLVMAVLASIITFIFGSAVGLTAGRDNAFLGIISATLLLISAQFDLSVGSIVGFTAYIWLLKYVPATKVATYTYVNPVIAVFLGWLILDEAVTSTTIAAVVVIVLAVVLAALHQFTAKRTSPAVRGIIQLAILVVSVGIFGAAVALATIGDRLEKDLRYHRQLAEDYPGAMHNLDSRDPKRWNGPAKLSGFPPPVELPLSADCPHQSLSMVARDSRSHASKRTPLKY